MRLHNTIQELRGNIRVFCRVRPAADDSKVVVTTQENKVSITNGSDQHNFAFDKVFGMTANQSDVFVEVSDLVQSALDGYKVCIFAYGQTGSGKTYTMQGNEAPEESLGLIPRALAQIFRTSEDMRVKGWTWSLQVSFMEVYNETIRDLLRNGDAAAGPSTPHEQHMIAQHDAWGTVVTGMSCVKVDSMKEINSLIALAAKYRSVGATNMNEDSSRSHSIMALYLQGTNQALDRELRGALHLVDLAGSERLDKSHATGDRLRETRNINRSLSSLVDVFMAKAEGRAHVPFRNSKLTHIMEPCLSGQGKAVMFVNVQPDLSNMPESLCSLRFARQVNQCTTGGKACRHSKSLASQPLKSRSPSPQSRKYNSPSPPPATTRLRGEVVGRRASQCGARGRMRSRGRGPLSRQNSATPTRKPSINAS